MAFSMFKFHDSWIILLFALFVSFASCEEVNHNNADNDRNWDRWTFDWNWTPPTVQWNWTPPPIRFRTYGPPPDGDDDFHNRNFETSNDTPIFVIIFVPIVIVIILIVICKFACKGQCGDCDGSSSNSTSPTLHPPPRPNTTYPARPAAHTTYNLPSTGTPARITPTGSTSAIPHIAAPIVHPTAPVLHPTAPYYNSPYAVNSDVSSAADKPPDYSTVVFDDLIEQEEKFPIVKKMESAPPKYDEKY